jgi:tetratricopeptide (TPR) repeat protein
MQSFLAKLLWLHGYPDQALALARRITAEAAGIGHPGTFSYVLTEAACPLALWTGELGLAEIYINMAVARSRDRGLEVWRSRAVCYQAGLKILQGRVAEGIQEAQVALDKMRRNRLTPLYSFGLSQFASAMIQMKRYDDAGAMLEEAIQISEAYGLHWALPEMYRVAADLALDRDGESARDEAEWLFATAMAMARKQGALSWELRIATSWSKLRLSQVGPRNAINMLTAVRTRFTEGFSTVDLRTADNLLANYREHLVK